ncbi:MAG: hypothetical protein VX294_08450 [Candidatus Latescibacterota bacterium]|nr:hypothetical protein [Candidatus Latescibacterota bacterium]
MFYLSRFSFCLSLVICFCFISGRPAAARSTLIVSPSSPVIVGAGVSQEVIVALKYFVGDGEAITETRIRPKNGDKFKIDSLKSDLGEVVFQGDGTVINYRMKPLVRESIDTLKIYGAVEGNLDYVEWEFKLFSTASQKIAHEVIVNWPITGLELPYWKVEPQAVYQGEHADLRLSVNYQNKDGLQLNGVKWVFPPEMKSLEGPTVRLNGQWGSGEMPELLKGVRVDPVFSGDIHIKSVLSIEGLPDVFLPAQKVRVDPLPRVAIVGDVLTVGKPGEVKCKWFNDGDVSIPLSSVHLRVHPSFSDVTIKAGHSSATIETNEDGRSVVVDGLELIEPGQEIEVSLSLVAQRPGPFLWESLAHPVGRREAVVLSGPLTILSTWGQNVSKDYSKSSPTDLELFSKAVSDGMKSQMQGLPFSFNVPIFLKGEGDSDSNWVVEDAISEGLRSRGYKLLVRPPNDGTPFSTVYYRLVSSRVNYTKKMRWFNFMGSTAKREAFLDVLVRFQDNGGLVRWQRRIRAYGFDQIPIRQMAVLGGGNSIKQTVTESDNMVIERGLSAGIIGSLIYIFFIL